MGRCQLTKGRQSIFPSGGTSLAFPAGGTHPFCSMLGTDQLSQFAYSVSSGLTFWVQCASLIVIRQNVFSHACASNIMNPQDHFCSSFFVSHSHGLFVPSLDIEEFFCLEDINHCRQCVFNCLLPICGLIYLCHFIIHLF